MMLPFTRQEERKRKMNIESLIKEYLTFSKEFKAKGTYDYDLTISNYISSYKWDLDFEYIRVKDVNDFLLFIRQNYNLSNKTINKVIKFLKSLAKFNNINNHDILNYKLLREKYRRFDMLSKNDIKKIIVYLEKMQNRGNANQYKMMVLLLFDTGIRQSELLNIKISDIDHDNKCILIKARKSNYDRYVYLSNEVYKRVKSYKSIANNKDLLFYNHLRNREFNRNDLKLFYKRLKKATGIDKIHSHMFRHTYATDLIELDVPLFVVQQQLGHASIKTTEIYYHASQKYQKEAMKKISNKR